MGTSHQTGSLLLRGKCWYGFYRKEVIDPTTENVRSVRVCVRLGLKSQMTKLKARDALKAEIARQTGQLADGRILKDGTVTFEWFVRNRLRVQGVDATLPRFDRGGVYDSREEGGGIGGAAG